jgi:hypothetical protein
MLKLDRAKEHFHSFLSELRTFYESQPWEFVSCLEHGDLVLRLKSFEKIPLRLSVLIGDLIHNARSALDCAVVELAHRGMGTVARPPTDTEEGHFFFPITDTEKQFNRIRRRLQRFLSDSVLDAIAIVQPWSEVGIRTGKTTEQGSESMNAKLVLHSKLRRLTRLSNIDKHRRLSLTLFRPHSVSEYDPAHPLPSLDNIDSLEGVEWLKTASTKPPQLVTLPDGFSLPEPEYEFYFACEELTEGAEIGRYIRADGRPMHKIDCARKPSGCTQ